MKALSGLTGFCYLGVAGVFWMGGLEAQAYAAASTALAAALAYVMARVGWVQPGAFLVTLTLAVAPIVQASLDSGVRDPALALAVLAPLTAAMVLSTRTAVATVVVIVVGVGALLVLDLMGMTLPSAASSDELAGYTVLAVLSGAAFSVLAGALYERHTRETLDAAEERAGQLDAALHESEVRYRTLVNEIPIGIYRTAPDGTVLLANQHLATLVGAASIEDALGLRSIDFYQDPEARERLRETLDRDGSVRRYPVAWKMPSGETRSVQIDARAIRDEAGAVEYYEGVVEDVTMEKLAQEAVEQSEARFRALVQRSSDVTAVLDRAGCFRYVSPSSETLLGYDPGDLVGQPATQFVHAEDRASVAARLSQIAEGASAPPIEMRLHHAAGHVIYIEGIGTPLFDDPAVEGLVINLRDVTERHRARNALIHAKRQAEELSRIKSTFLSNMSHEIRTPLTAILGFADVLRDEVDGQGSEFVELIMESGERLLDTLSTVLDLARMDAGQEHFTQERVDVGLLVREVMQRHAAEAATRGLALTLDDASETHLALLDSAAFKKALHHILGNAIKFTDEGSITVGLRTVEERVHVHIRDTGTGISPEFLPRLFVPFEQESTGAERTHEGAGLGLAVVQKLVERMGGTVQVRSRKGEGSLFTIIVPRAARVGAVLTPAQGDGALRPRVLIVDDDESSRFVAENALAEWYEVRTAASAREAIDLADGSFDLFVLDIYMGPEGSGEDVLRALRRREDTAQTPIVAVTAYGLPGDRGRLLSAGFDGYLRKPYTQSQLRAEVTQAIQARTGQPTPNRSAEPVLLVRNAAFGAAEPQSDPTAAAAPTFAAAEDAATRAYTAQTSRR